MIRQRLMSEALRNPGIRNGHRPTTKVKVAELALVVRISQRSSR
jgi:hypothetical protein